jgi:hypothetical protein
MLPSISINQINELIRAGKTFEIQEKFMALRQAALEVQEQNLELKKRIQELERKTSVKGEMVFEPPVYWKELEGGGHEPYCQVCYDVHSRLVKVQERESKYLGRYFYCQACNKTY